MDRKPIHFRTDQKGLDVDPTNGAIIKGRDGYTPLTFENQIDHTYILSPTGDVIFAQPGQENVVVPGNMAVEIPANSLGTFNYSNSNNMNNMQYAQEGGASSDQQQQKIISMVAQGLQQGADPKQIMQELVKMGMSVEQAQGLVTAVAKELQASQEEQVSQQDEQDMMQQDQEQQMGMAEMGGEPCIDCFDHYNPSPQAQNLNWYYKAQGGESLPKAGLGNLGNFLGGFGNMGNSMMGMGNPINNPMYSDLYGKSDKEGMLMQQAMNGQIPINQLPANLQVQMNNPNAMKAGGQAFNEQFPQAIPYGRPAQTLPNFMFAEGGDTSDQWGGQSDIDRAYQIMKKGGFAVNPKKKKGGKFNGVDEFAKYLEKGGGLKTYAPGGPYDDPNHVFEDIQGKGRKVKFDRQYNEWFYEESDGTKTPMSSSDQSYYDYHYRDNPGIGGGNGSGSNNSGNNQGGNNQGSGNSGGGFNPGGSNFSNPYASYIGGNAITQLLGSQAGAGLGLLGQALGALGAGSGSMGMMGLMGKPKFRGTYYNADGKKQRFRSKGVGALEAIPYYFGASGSGSGPGSNNNNTKGPGAGNTNDNTVNDGITTSTSPSPYDDMKNDKNFNYQKYHNMDRALRHYNRGVHNLDYSHKGWKNARAEMREQNILAMNNDANFDSTKYNSTNRALRHYNRGQEGDHSGKGWIGYDDSNNFNDFTNPKYSLMTDPSQTSFDWRLYRNPNKALRQFNRGISSDSDYDRGKGWNRSNEIIREGNIARMQGSAAFDASKYHNINRALRHYNRGVEDLDYSGKGWGGGPDGEYETGGMTKYAPGGDAHWTFSYRTPLSGMNNYMNTMAFQSGVMSGIKENDRKALYKNAQDNFNTVSTGLAYKGAANKAPTRNGTPSPVGTTNYMGMNAYTPGNQNFGYNNFPSAYLTQIGEAKMGGSILDDYQDGSEIDLSHLSPEEQDAFIQQIYEAGGSVEFI